MTFIHILFYMCAIPAICSATLVITLRNSVYGVLALVFTFLSTAGIWLLLRAEFLAWILVLVYVGAVMTLFLFVVMMLNVKIEPKKEGFVKYAPVAVLLIVMMIVLMIATVGPKYFGLAKMPEPALVSANFSNTAALGDVLYTYYAFPFEVAGVLLLAAIISAISLTHRKTYNKKMQNVAKQIEVNPKNRVRLVKLDRSTT